MKSLPIGISTLKNILENGMVYVDKTEIILPLVKAPGRYFLSRPRRFGKSLLVDTFKELFEGNETLFRGLAIHERWDWSKKHPVVKIDFAGGTLRSQEDLDNKLVPVLDRHAGAYGITLTSKGTANRLNELIHELNDKTGLPVVVLADEYDKPLLDNIENPERALEMREALKDFYSTLKEVDGLLRFVFLTGVSKFSKVNIFSGINNLKDISLDGNFATICGYTQGNLETVFAEHLAGVDWEQLKFWYNGYNFRGEAVYNPFDILLFISENHTYRNFWFETGTPDFLIKLLQKNRYFLPDLEDIEVSDEQMGSFDVDRLPPAVLLFQTGYLTIKNSFTKRGLLNYRLQVPNQEVRLAFTNALVESYTGIFDQRLRYQNAAYESLVNGDMPALEAAIKRLFAGVPWRNYRNNDLSEYEGYYASVLYAFFTSITCTVIPEDTTNHGQADLTIILEDTICVSEIKVLPTEAVEHSGGMNRALEQIQERNYALKYSNSPEKRVFEVGMVFSQTERNLVSFDYREK